MGHYMEKILNEKNEEIHNHKNCHEVGKVSKVMGYLIEVTGLNSVAYFDRVEIAGKACGYVSRLARDRVIVALVELNDAILIDDDVFATDKEFKAFYSRQSIGRVVDIFANDCNVNLRLDDYKEINVENNTIPIMERSAVTRPLLTGISGIDLIYPIGKGQRQLILGDKKTGKTQLGLDTIVNQKGKNMICIYVSLGKTKKAVKEIYQELTRKNAMAYTIILAAFNDDPAPVIYLTPYVALSIAEEWMHEGNDVLVIIDDLKRHADNYREIALMMDKQPGRDAYPSDIFYTHSRLLEKGCQYNNGGSITILPIVETKSGDITDYISTNIISITDGQIVLSKKDFEKGQKPAINYGLSVSRLGGAVQSKEMKKVGTTIRRELLSYLETRDIYELANTEQMSPVLQMKLIRGKQIVENLKQYKYSPLSEEVMIERFSKLLEE